MSGQSDDFMDSGHTMPATKPTRPTHTSPTSGGGDDLDDDLGGPTIKGLQSDTMVFDRFHLDRVVGRGGMGVVWRAENVDLKRTVAIKFVPDILRSDAAALDELRSETKKGQKLTHPNIVRILDFLEEEGAAGIVMEYIDGDNLSAQRLTHPGKVFSPSALQPYLNQLLDALEYAHETVGIVHRDIKPMNLMANSGGELKLTDFGIACAIHESASRVSHQLASTSGSALYMSPQQMLGETPRPADDYYAMGATLYELLTSKPPFVGSDIYRQIEKRRPQGLNERRAELEIDATPIPEAWETTVLALLEREAEDRPADMEAVRAGFRGEPIHRGNGTTKVTKRRATTKPGAASTSSFNSDPSDSTSRPWMIPAMTAATIVVLAAIGGGIYKYIESERLQKEGQIKLAQEIAKEAAARTTFATFHQDLDTRIAAIGEDAHPRDAVPVWGNIIKEIEAAASPYPDIQERLDTLLTRATALYEEALIIDSENNDIYIDALANLESGIEEATTESARTDLGSEQKAVLWNTLADEYPPTAIDVRYDEDGNAKKLITKVASQADRWKKRAELERPTGTLKFDDFFTAPQQRGWAEYGKRDLAGKAQQFLISKGYLTGKADKSPGANTQKALLTWQQAEELPMTAALDASSLEKMNLHLQPEAKAPVVITKTVKSGSSSSRGSSSGSSGSSSTGSSWQKWVPRSAPSPRRVGGIPKPPLPFN